MEAKKELKKNKAENSPSNFPQIPSNPQIPNPQSPIPNPEASNPNPQSHSPQQVPIPKNDNEEKEERERRRKKEYNEKIKKKKEEERKKKEEKLKKLHENQKILREKEKILKKNRESLDRIYGEMEENEEEDQEVTPVPEYPNQKGGKIMVFGEEKGHIKELKEEEKERKRKFMAAKRGLDLEFLLTYYENLRNKEIKIQEKKKNEEENPEKLWGYHQKIEEIGEKYNNKLKKFIGENRSALNLKYSFSFPEELPPYESPEETRKAFFSKLFEGKKRAPETPIEFILDADRAKRRKKREVNKKYYNKNKKKDNDFDKIWGFRKEVPLKEEKEEKEIEDKENQLHLEEEEQPEEHQEKEEEDQLEEHQREHQEEEEDDDGIEDLGELRKKRKKLNLLLILNRNDEKKVEELTKKINIIKKKIKEMLPEEDF